MFMFISCSEPVPVLVSAEPRADFRTLAANLLVIHKRMPAKKLCSVFLLLAAAVPSALAQNDAQKQHRPSLSRVNQLDAAIDAIASSLKGSNPNETADKKAPRDVIWLLDHTSVVRDHNLYSRLADAIRTSFDTGPDGFRGSRHTLLTLNDQLQSRIQRAGDPSQVKNALAGLVQKEPVHRVKNVYRAVQRVVSGLKGAVRKPVLILLTLQNGDAEYQLETTARMLVKQNYTVHVIGREAIFSDSFYLGNHRLNPGTNVRKAGSEGPFRMFPSGWILQRQRERITRITPSGFGLYGLQRLVNVTGGTYFMYYPEEFRSPYCEAVSCAFCGGAHMSCNRPYRYQVLDRFSPWVGSRRQYKKQLADSRLARRYFSVWRKAHSLGVVSRAPPFHLQTGRVIKPAHATSLRDRFAYGNGLKQLLRRAGTARKKAAKLNVLIQKIEGIHQKPVVEYRLPRIAANAKLLDLLLRATRFNLKQLVRFARRIRTLHRLKEVPDDLLHPLQMPLQYKGELTWNGSRTQYEIRGYTFCHGPKQIRSVRFLGGKRGDQGIRKLARTVRKVLRELKGTPWELAARRINVITYRTSISKPARSSSTGKGTPPRSRRDYPASEEAEIRTKQQPARPGGLPRSTRQRSPRTKGKRR